ncbi:MAG: hypothetical protein J7M17_05600 [Anaerolineae bacterium]|nr:hypothetical protein [Anaerolineae bacterium]
MKSPIKQYRHLKRYQEIVRILIRHEFGGIVDQLGLLPALSLPSRLLRRRPVKPHLTPAAHVRLALEELSPTFIKFGQILSTRPDLIPPAYIQELEKLQDVVPPAPWDAIKTRIKTEIKASLEETFTTFDPTPIAAASISQVHQAYLLNNPGRPEPNLLFSSCGRSPDRATGGHGREACPESAKGPARAAPKY